jgi:hypothetical protein
MVNNYRVSLLDGHIPENSMADFNRPAPKKHAINEKKLQLHSPNASGKNATLKFNVNKNYPRIDVYTNDDNDPKAKDPIRAAMDQPCFFLFLQLLKDAAHSKEAMENTIENVGHTFYGGKRSEKPEVISRTEVGRDDKGVVYICVTAKGRPKIKFSLAPTNWNRLINSSTGEKIGESKASTMVALAWATMLSEMVSTYLVFGYEEPEEQPQRQGGGGGQWSKPQGGQSSGGGGYQEDNLPF